MAVTLSLALWPTITDQRLQEIGNLPVSVRDIQSD
jgi:hypothetical protein